MAVYCTSSLWETVRNQDSDRRCTVEDMNRYLDLSIAIGKGLEDRDYGVRVQVQSRIFNFAMSRLASSIWALVERPSVVQELPGILWNRKVHKRVHKSHIPVSFMSQINPVRTVPSYPSLRSVLILPSNPRLHLTSGLKTKTSWPESASELYDRATAACRRS
jgi:hypothetical protein